MTTPGTVIFAGVPRRTNWLPAGQAVIVRICSVCNDQGTLPNGKACSCDYGRTLQHPAWEQA